jgi:hypothetical protein
MEWHDRADCYNVLRLRSTRPDAEVQADVPDQIWWFQHRHEKSNGKSLVRGDGAQELVRRDVVYVNKARRGAHDEKRGRERDC